MPRRWIPITVLGVIGAGLIAIIVSLSVGEHKEGQIQVEGVEETQSLLGGIRQLDNRLGNSDAPVTVNLFTDVQCPRCAEFQSDVVDPLIADYVRTGKVQMTFRNFPLGLKPVTVGAIAVEAAAEQDHGWQYAELFMKNLDQVPEKGVDQNFLDAIAAATPQLDTAAWEEADSAPDAAQSAQQDVDLATNMRLPANPILIVEGPSGSVTLEDVPSLQDVKDAIDQVG